MSMSTKHPELVLESFPLGPETSVAPWPTVDPFLFCVHHADDYPPGDGRFGPAASLAGRQLGHDFEGRDGWRMYHGERVPGFPRHPHRGFETVTIARRGFIDHSDSLGAAARFGQGDVQWLTAGAGIVHAEMFPLLNTEARNPTELFQIWLNLPRASKMAAPHFSMLWAETVPRLDRRDEFGQRSEVTVVAGAFEDAVPPRPPPSSWAARQDAEVAIWTVRLEPKARLTLPAIRPPRSARSPQPVLRTLYLFRGNALRLTDGDGARSVELSARSGAVVFAHEALRLEAGERETELLVLQGRAIGEPIVAHGPFVMNGPEEIRRAFVDFQRTGFGGWPWDDDGPVHGSERARFARHPDGRVECR